MEKKEETTYSQEQLAQIEKLAEDMMSPLEISFLLGFDESSFKDAVNTPGSPVRKAYMSGVARTTHALNQSIREAARAGSPASIEQSVQILSAINAQLME